MNRKQKCYFDLFFIKRINEYAKIDKLKSWSYGTARAKYNRIRSFYLDELDITNEELIEIELFFKYYKSKFDLYFNEARRDFFLKDPEKLIEYVKTIRKVESYMGTGIKFPSFDETLTRKSLQKCLVANIDIKKGDIFSEDMLVAKRTGGKGISPVYYKNITGEIAPKDFQKNDIIEIK